MSDEAWQRQRKVYAMLERAGGKGIAACDVGGLSSTLDKVWGRPEPRCFRAYDWARGCYVYVLAKFWDGRYTTWIGSDGDTTTTSKDSSSTSSSELGSEAGCESTASPPASDASGHSTSPSSTNG